ncbi:YdeI/OmpD-associated family protein [Amedibacillus sp. YH-ame6]
MNDYRKFETRKEFRDWLMEHCLSSEGIWLYFDKAKKSSTLKASEALEEALCFGWIDGQMKSLNETGYVKYFSLHRKNSKWSEKNKKLVMELEKNGTMSDFGRAKIQEAKENGQWDVNHTIVIENEDINLLLSELQGIEPAYTNFVAMSPSVKKTYVKAYKDAKTTEGKQKRFSWIVERLNKNLKPM